MMSRFWLLSVLILTFIGYSSAAEQNSTIRAPSYTYKGVNHVALARISSSLSSLQASPSSSSTKPSATVAAAAAVATANATEVEIQNARAIVAAAHASQSAYNEYQLAHPRFNTHRSRHSSSDTEKGKKRDEAAIPQPELSDEVKAAVQLVAHVDAKAMAQNSTLFSSLNRTSSRKPTTAGYSNFKPNITHSKRDGADFWMANMEHLGTQPFGGDDSYVVWRNVMDYGAVGDGVADDTAAIQNAIADGNRCGVDCLSSSVKGAIVYFPEGTYLVSQSISMYYNTQIVGAIDPDGQATPTIMAASSFTGFGVLSSDVYLPGGQSEWYIEQSNFYRQIRNLNIDLTQATLYNIAGIHWQVAQATSIYNVEIYMTPAATSSQIGIWAENGSGGWLSFIFFHDGLYGFLGGNQQYTVSNLYFEFCANGVGLIWDWAWTWTEIQFISCDTAINLNPPGASLSDPVGSIYLMDVSFTGCGTCIYTFPFTSNEQGTTVFTFDNIFFSGNTYFMLLTNGEYLVYDVSSGTTMDFVTLGDIQDGGTFDGFYTVNVPTRQSVLTYPYFDYSQDGYFRREKPTYYQTSADSFINAKNYAYGDGVTDDTAIIQDLLDFCAYYGYILFFPAGSYMISSTLVVPVNSYIVGEVWSQLVAYGSNFADETNPQALLVVGDADTGNIEMQDLLFTSVGNLPGLVLVYWNVNAASQGSAAMWDCHFRVGGALGTGLQVAQCPIKSGGIITSCIAASIMFLVDPSANGYFENVWAWNADHDIDDPANTQVDIYVGRGMLIMSDGPSWFYGTASEHSVLYQYNVVNANNIFMSMIQTESPYFQGYGATQAPLPFEQVVLWVGDPTFDMCGSATTTCNMAWAVIIQSSNNIFINGAGLYSWFQDYDETCVNTVNCQQRLINIYRTSSLWFNHIITIGSVEVVTPAIGNELNEIVYASSVTQALVYPWWTAIAVYLDSIASTAISWPIQDGFVAFGESYSSGIGAGVPLDNVKGCYRGTGSYPAILNKYWPEILNSSGVELTLDFQFLSCSGSQSPNVLNDQIPGWDPTNTNAASVNVLGNDAGFGAIVTSCIVGFDKSTPCAETITNAQNFVAGSNGYIDDWVNRIVGKLVSMATKDRFLVYWIGYPEFWSVEDHTCDSDYFWIWPANSWHWYSGEYLLLSLREQLNDISIALNARIGNAINNWNANLPYPQVVFVNPDVGSPHQPAVYYGLQFCQPGVTEPQSAANQGSVAFFYPNGPDRLPTETGFVLPDPEPGAPDSWSAEIDTINSVTDCILETDAAGNSIYPYFWCDMAVTLAADPSAIPTFEAAVQADVGDYNTTATLNADGSVTITGSSEGVYAKMFHPKSFIQYTIGHYITNNLRYN